MSERGLTEKAYSRYLRNGDYAIDRSTGFPLIVRDNCARSYTRLCEVFGFFHEFGSVYSKDLRPLSEEGVDEAKERMASR